MYIYIYIVCVFDRSTYLFEWMTWTKMVPVATVAKTKQVWQVYFAGVWVNRGELDHIFDHLVFSVAQVARSLVMLAQEGQIPTRCSQSKLVEMFILLNCL